MTGEHAERAGETALAIDCFEQAGREAEKRFANAAAVSWLRRALVLLDESEPLRRFDLLSRLQAIAESVGDLPVQDSQLAEMALLLERDPNDPAHAEMLFHRALLALRRSDYANAERLARQCFELAAPCGSAWPAAMAQGIQAYYKMSISSDYLGAQEHIDIALQWANKIEAGAESRRPQTEIHLMNISAMVSRNLCRYDAARDTLHAVLSRCEDMSSPRLQLGALVELAEIAEDHGLWEEVAGWAERMRAVADDCGAQPRLGHALGFLGLAAAGLNDPDAALRWYRQALHISRATGDRLAEVRWLRSQGEVQFERGDVSAALASYAGVRTLYELTGVSYGRASAAAGAALCKTRLGQSDEALSEVDPILASLGSDPGEDSASDMQARWRCQQVLQSLGDERATPLLEQLHANVQATAAQRTDADDRDRLIHAIPTFRAIVAAWSAAAATRSA